MRLSQADIEAIEEQLEQAEHIDDFISLAKDDLPSLIADHAAALKELEELREQKTLTLSIMGPPPASVSHWNASAWKCHADRVEIALAAALDKLRVAREALEFYKNPWGQKDKFGDPVSIPDFYDEMCFGDRADEALAQIRGEG